MKLLVLGSVFCTAAMAVGQSAGEKPSGAVTVFQLPQGAVLLDSHSAQLPNSSLSPSMDAGSIVHPPAGSFVMQPPLALMPQAQKLYPDLKLQPVETAKMEPIPLQWPKAKVEQIPTQWQRMKVIPVQTSSPATVPSVANTAKKK